MQTVTLNNGVEMPILGFGVFQIPDASIDEGHQFDVLGRRSLFSSPLPLWGAKLRRSDQKAPTMSEGLLWSRQQVPRHVDGGTRTDVDGTAVRRP